MLGRKSSCAGMSAAVVGVDRSRVGERLQAALAGLQELHLLKDRQRDMVSWALRVDREEPVSSVQAGLEDPNMMGVEEQRLEATLTALKQQLVGHFYHRIQLKKRATAALTCFFFLYLVFICCGVLSFSSNDADSAFNYYQTLS